MESRVSRRDLLGGAIAGVFAGASLVRAAEARASAARPVPAGVGPLLASPPEALARFMGYRYGAFIHWGPASVSGKEISWTREIDTPTKEYDQLYTRFNPVEFNADAWVGMLKESGFRYLTFVTKHHEGFAMWNTKTTTHSIMNTPFGRDVLGELAVACKRHQLPLCLYYSIADFFQPDCVGASYANGLYLGPPGYSLPPGAKPDFGRYVSYMKAQLKELVEGYGPIAAWWFDGGWQREWTQERGVDLLKFLRSLQPDTLTNQRIGCAYNGRVYMPTWFPTDKGYVGDFAVLEVDTPRFNRVIPWEYTSPANGRSYCWTPGPYGDPNAWIENLVKSACGDGNYLLGLTPPASGRFDTALVDKLAIAKLWLTKYGSSVLETRGGPYMRTNVYGSTCKGNRVYLHVFPESAKSDPGCWPTCEVGHLAGPNELVLELPPLPVRILSAHMPSGGAVKVEQKPQGVRVAINKGDVEIPSTIVVFELESSAESIEPISEVSVTKGAGVRSSNIDPSTDEKASDGNMDSCWVSDGRTKQPWLEYDLGGVKSISRAILFEGAYEGELANIHRFQIDVKTDGDWQRVADVTTWGFETGQEEDFYEWPMSVFHPEIRFKPTNARLVRLKILKSVGTPTIHQFEVYER